MALIGSSGQFGGGMLNPQSTVGGRPTDQYGVPMYGLTTNGPKNPWDDTLNQLLASIRNKPGSVAGNWAGAQSLLDRATGITPSWAKVTPQQIGASTIADPRAAINATLPGLREAAASGFATAGGRLGQSGFAMSTPYAAQVAGVARKQANDLASTTQQMQYDAAKTRAANALDAAKANQQASLTAGMANSQGGLTSQEDLQKALLTGASTAGNWASDVTSANANANNNWMANMMSLYNTGNSNWNSNPNNQGRTDYYSTDPNADARMTALDVGNREKSLAGQGAQLDYANQHFASDADTARNRDLTSYQQQQDQYAEMLKRQGYSDEQTQMMLDAMKKWMDQYGSGGSKPPWWGG